MEKMDFEPSLKGWEMVVELQCGMGHVFQAEGKL